MLGFLVLGYAVTPLHPGVGRTPGTVDLPVQRDPMGYPIVFASSVKGAFKAECARRVASDGSCFNGEGRIRCNEKECSLCCCLFGHEPGQEETASGLLSVLDFVPLFIPVPSLSHGYLYMTSPYLAARALAILEALNEALRRDGGSLPEEVKGLREVLTEAAKADGYRACSEVDTSNGLYIVTSDVKGKLGDAIDCSGLQKLSNKLRGLAEKLASRLVVVPDSDAQSIVEKSLIRITRVRLNLATKTVSERALWTEEYIPQGSIFLGGFIATLPKKNRYCTEGFVDEETAKRKVNEFLKKLAARAGCTAYAIVGGKETIGKGLLKLITIPCPA